MQMKIIQGRYDMITMKHYSFVSKDGVTIKGICMIPEKPVAILQMVHGMNEHKERYLGFMEKMAEKGYVTLMHDNRGHGESIKDEDDLGYCYGLLDKGMVEDVYTATVRIKKRYPDLPLILYGHSMGSLIVRSFLKKHDDVIDGLIVAGSPSYQRAVPYGRILVETMMKLKGDRYRSKLVSKLAVGSFNKPFLSEKRQYAWLTTDVAVSEAFINDPLCSYVYTLNGYLTLLNLETAVYKEKDYNLKNANLPILFISGENDPCKVNDKKWSNSMEILRRAGYKNVSGITYEGMRHEIHNEPDKQLVFNEIDRFCTVCRC